MDLYFMFLSVDELRDATKTGWAWALKNKSKWVKKNEDKIHDVLYTGFAIGSNFLVHDGKVYSYHSQFTLIDENAILYIMKESERGCDLKTF